MRVDHEGGAAAWLVGTLVAPSVQGHRLPPVMALSESFLQPVVAGDQRPLWPGFLHSTMCSGT